MGKAHKAKPKAVVMEPAPKQWWRVSWTHRKIEVTVIVAVLVIMAIVAILRSLTAQGPEKPRPLTTQEYSVITDIMASKDCNQAADKLNQALPTNKSYFFRGNAYRMVGDCYYGAGNQAKGKADYQVALDNFNHTTDKTSITRLQEVVSGKPLPGIQSKKGSSNAPHDF